jgi:hypothetical protein
VERIAGLLTEDPGRLGLDVLRVEDVNLPAPRVSGSESTWQLAATSRRSGSGSDYAHALEYHASRALGGRSP